MSFYGEPKLVSLATGEVLHRWEGVYSGRETSCIFMAKDAAPAMALDPIGKRFAIATGDQILAVQCE